MRRRRLEFGRGDDHGVGGSSGGTALQGVVGPGFDISLTRNGRPVTKLAPGTYTLTVDDMVQPARKLDERRPQRRVIGLEPIARRSSP